MQPFQTALQHHQAGRFPQAEAIYLQILTQQPGNPDVLQLLGALCYQTGRSAESADLLRRAIAINGSVADWHFNLGNALLRLERVEEAVTSYAKAYELKPSQALFGRKLVAARVQLGLRHSGAGRLEQAVDAFRAALDVDPDNLDAIAHLGDSLTDLHRMDEAIEMFAQGARLHPDSALIHNSLSYALLVVGRCEEAIGAIERALEIKPDLSGAWSNLAAAYANQGRMEQAEQAYLKAVRAQPDFAGVHSNYIYHLNHCAHRTREEVFQAHLQWNQQHATPLTPTIAPHANERSPDRRLRIGYVSADFRRHSVSYFLEPILANHDHANFEIHCFADGAASDDVTARLRGHADRWHAVGGMSDSQVAQLVRDQRIDILVDLGGHTGMNRMLVFARKPAPVQVTYLGYPNTTGLITIDYRLTDAIADPPFPPGNCDSLHTETLLRLPGCFLCYRLSPDLPPIAPRPGDTSDITFGSFNHLAKTSPLTIRLWADVLRAVPNSRLLLKYRSLADPGTRDHILKQFQVHNISPDRLDLRAHESSHLDHLKTYDRVDIALDTFPYNGTTTTCEALSMGVPVVTLAGDRHVSRVGASLLSAIDLPDLIAHDEAQYIATATSLAHDPSRLASLRANMRTRLTSSILTNESRFTRHLESAYRQIWQTWCSAS